MKYFEENNICKNSDLENVSNYKKNKGEFHIKITPGVNFSSFTMRNSMDLFKNSYDFDSETSIRIGAEFEYVLPFNKNKWSIFIDPNYYSYSSQLTKELESRFPTIKPIVKVDITIKKIAIPIGVRYNFFLNENIKIFIDAGVRHYSDLGSSIVFDKAEDLEINSSGFGVFGGLGINIISKYSAEIRYFSSDYLINYTYWSSEFRTVSFILGYNFL